MEANLERFEALFDRHARAVRAYCRRRLLTAADAHDAAAEVFVVAWRRMEELPDDDALLPWLYGVARRVIANQQRTRRRRRRLLQRLSGLGSLPPDGPEERAVRSSADPDVVWALEALSERDREIVRLVAWEELSREDAAVVLGCSVEAAKKRYQRAIRRLERMLSDRQESVPGTIAGLGERAS